MRKYLKYQSKTAKTKDNVKIFYKILKPGKNNTEKTYMIFLHGMFLNHTVLRKEANYFGKKEYGIILYDYRGHGKSSKPRDKQKYKINKFADDLKFLIEKEQIEKVILIGYSFGGMIIASAYHKIKQYVKNIIFIDIPIEDPFHQLSKKTTLKKFLKKEWSDFFHLYNKIGSIKHKLAHEQKKEIDFNSKEFQHGMGYKGMTFMPWHVIEPTWENMFTYSPKEDLSKIKRPCLAILGTLNDYVADVTSAEKITKIIKYLTVEHIKADHYMVVMKTQKIERIMQKFLKNQQKLE